MPVLLIVAWTSVAFSYIFHYLHFQLSWWHSVGCYLHLQVHSTGMSLIGVASQPAIQIVFVCGSFLAAIQLPADSVRRSCSSHTLQNAFVLHYGCSTVCRILTTRLHIISSLELMSLSDVGQRWRRKQSWANIVADLSSPEHRHSIYVRYSFHMLYAAAGSHLLWDWTKQNLDPLTSTSNNVLKHIGCQWDS